MGSDVRHVAWDQTRDTWRHVAWDQTRYETRYMGSASRLTTRQLMSRGWAHKGIEMHIDCMVITDIGESILHPDSLNEAADEAVYR